MQPKWVQVDWCHARDHCYLIIRAWDHSLLTAGLAAPRGKRQVIRTTRLLERETADWGKAIKAANIKMD